MIDTIHSDISIQRQCALIGLSRSSYYYPANLNGHHSSENLFYMSLIDQKYIERPFYGSRRMTHYVHNLGYQESQAYQATNAPNGHSGYLSAAENEYKRQRS